MQYKVLSAWYLVNLESQVNRHIKDGWVPTGPMQPVVEKTYGVVEEGFFSNTTGVVKEQINYTQAMVKNDEPKKETD